MDYNKRYERGYTAYVNGFGNKIKKTTKNPNLHSLDEIPKLDETGCSKLVVLHYKYCHNPVGMDGQEHDVIGFFHAKATDHGWWLVLGDEGFSRCFNWLPEGWKKVKHVDADIVLLFSQAKEKMD